MNNQPSREFTIVFESTRLPNCACYLDVAASLSSLIAMPDKVSTWFWHFCICKGCTMHDKSSLIVSNAQCLLEELQSHDSSVIQEISTRITWLEPDQVYLQWIQALKVIISKSNGKEISSWSGIG